MKQIYIIKLISGIELISNVSLDDEALPLFDQVVYLDKPLRFGQVPDGKGGQAIGFFQYLIAEPEPFALPINGSTIESYVSESQMDEALVKEYKERTSVIQLI